MPGIIYEHVSSRTETVSYTQPDAELVYMILGEPDPLAARALLLATAPPTYNEVFYHHASLQPLSPDMWMAKAKYSKVENRFVLGFDFGGEKTKRLYTKKTIQSWNLIAREIGGFVPDDGPDYKGAIGVSDDKIDGVDIYARAFKMSMEWGSKLSSLRADYLELLESLIPSANDAPLAITWNGQQLFFDHNELLLISGSARQSSEDGATFSLKFEIQRAEQDIELGDRDDVEKEGWYYLWVRSRKAADQTRGAMYEVPVSANVEQVYDLKDFGGLEIFDVFEEPEG